MASKRFAFLNIGQMFADFHTDGISPVSYEWVKIVVKIGAMSSASSLSTLGEMLSGPAALWK